MKRAALIVAGGAGTRLWPLSTDDNPKQFLTLFGGRSLLQQCYARLTRIVPADAIYVSTNERYRDKCLAQLPDLPPENVLTEPARRNTGPALALSCFTIAARLGDVTIASIHADQHIADEAGYLASLEHAFAYAESSDSLVTLGIQPTSPNTGFGYLELGESLTEHVIQLNRFVEKPSLDRAEEFLRAGNYAWNAGIFVWRANAFRTNLEALAPELARLADAIVAEPEKIRELYEAMPSISIDHALMEKAANVATVRGDFGWDDVGSWAAVARLTSGAATESEDATGVFAVSTTGKPIVVIGMSNVAVIDSENGILVIDLAKSELLSAVVKRAAL